MRKPSNRLANFSTTVPSTKTAYEVLGMLARHGATSARMEYEGGEPSGVSFTIETMIGDDRTTLVFRLPCDWRGAKRALERNREATRSGKRVRVAEVPDQRAKDIAWRCLRDWIRAQLALIEIGAAKLEQVMLPYAVCGDGRTVYQRMLDARFVNVLPPAEGAGR